MSAQIAIERVAIYLSLDIPFSQAKIETRCARGGRYGLQAMRKDSGQANATILCSRLAVIFDRKLNEPTEGRNPRGASSGRRVCGAPKLRRSAPLPTYRSVDYRCARLRPDGFCLSTPPSTDRTSEPFKEKRPDAT